MADIAVPEYPGRAIREFRDALDGRGRDRRLVPNMIPVQPEPEGGPALRDGPIGPAPFVDYPNRMADQGIDPARLIPQPLEDYLAELRAQRGAPRIAVPNRPMYPRR